MQKVLNILAAVFFAVIIAAQSRIIFDGPVLSAYSELEPESGVEMTDRQTGTITLALSGAEPSEELRVLINGTVSALFTGGRITIVVTDNSLVEIDGRAVSEPFSVEVTGLSDNVTLADGKKYAYISGNVKTLTYVNLK